LQAKIEWFNYGSFLPLLLFERAYALLAALLCPKGGMSTFKNLVWFLGDCLIQTELKFWNNFHIYRPDDLTSESLGRALVQ